MPDQPTMIELLRALVGHEDEACRYDHDDLCQTHGQNRPCAVRLGRDLLEEIDGTRLTPELVELTTSYQSAIGLRNVSLLGLTADVYRMGWLAGRKSLSPDGTTTTDSQTPVGCDGQC